MAQKFYISLDVVQTKEWVSMCKYIISRESVVHNHDRSSLPVPSLQVKHIVQLQFNSLVAVHYFRQNDNYRTASNTCT